MLELTISAPGELGRVRAEMRAWLRQRLSDVHTDEILLASGEALANSIEHGRVPVTILLHWRDNALHLDVRDSGDWRVSAGSTSRGLGIPIMTALTDSLTFETTDGTTVTLSRRFST